MMTIQDDWNRTDPGDVNNVYTQYENNRMKHLTNQLKKAKEGLEVKEEEVNILVQVLHPKIGELEKCLAEGLLFIRGEMSAYESKQMCFTDIQSKCEAITDALHDINLPQVKPRWADITGAGPGVGVSNFEVRFRDTELALIHNSDYRVRIHNSRGSSGDNEAERTNSAIGDSIVDGATIQWEKYPKFHGLTNDMIATLTLVEYEEHEASRMEKNAWFVVEEVQKRIDGIVIFICT
jgi:hypothetical protein